MRCVTWTHKAAKDLRDIETYLSQYSQEMAQDTIERTIRGTDFLLEYPAAGAPVGHKRWRKWRVRATRYLLIYEPLPDGIRVGHVRYDRTNWQLAPD